MLQLVQSHVGTVYGLLQKMVEKIQEIGDLDPDIGMKALDEETRRSVGETSRAIHALAPALKSLRNVLAAFSAAGVESENFDFLLKELDGVLVQFKEIIAMAEMADVEPGDPSWQDSFHPDDPAW